MSVPAARLPRPSPRRILVVDDNKDAADSLAVLLRMAGHEVRAAYNGTDALVAARELRPDVALLDLAMPGGPTGYDLAPLLRREPGLEHVLLVAITGYGQEEDKRRCRDVGFDVHLTKPAEPHTVLGIVAGGSDGSLWALS